MFRFYSLWKQQKNKDFLVILGGKKRQQWTEVGYYHVEDIVYNQLIKPFQADVLFLYPSENVIKLLV